MALADPGCMVTESAAGADAFGISGSYWRDEASIAAWNSDARHLVAQEQGRDRWSSHYALRVARVDRHYDGPDGR